MTSPNYRFNGPLAERVSEWADSLIGGYLARHPTRGVDRKQIHDPIERIIELESWEVFVLDSPLVQRLRYIRQLGVGHFLFPTAAYSRFEHSLGALQMASTMFDAIVDAHRSESNGSAPGYSDQQFAQHRHIVRMAALLHDMGHCVFSHVSEKVYQQQSEVRAAQKHFRAVFRQSGITASETLTLLILQSPAFTKLISAARVPLSGGDELFIDQVMMCIAGSIECMAPNSYLAEIVNGPVDCDKLDYLARDAHMAGVPLPLDSQRLLSKLRIAVKRRPAGEDVYTLAIVPSGMRALDELQVARIFLYDKFYFHQKVMSAEELLRRAVGFLCKTVPAIADPAVLLQFGDDEFIALSPSSIASRFAVESTDEWVVAGCEMLGRVRNRDLPKRVFAMANRFLPESPELLTLFNAQGGSARSKELNVDFYQMSQQLSSLEVAQHYADRIRDKAAELGTTTEVYVANQAAGKAAGSMYLPVLRADRRLDERPRYLFASDFWSEAYTTNKSTSFVFADYPTADVFLAAERVFLEHWHLLFDRSCWVTAKVSEDDIIKRREQLPPEWCAHRLTSDFMEQPTTLARISALNKKFASFLTAFHSDFGPDLIECWVSQFQDSDLRDSAIAFLEHMTYVGPETIEAAFASHVHGDPALEKAIWVPFRPRKGPGDSADQLAVDLKTVARRNQHISSLSAEEIRSAGCVVFYDDVLNSGVQASCRLVSWFGGDQSACDHVDDLDAGGPLPPDVQEALRNVPIILVVYAKHPMGDARLRVQAQSLGLQLLDIRGVIDSGRPDYTLEGFRAASPVSRERFVRHIQQVGKQILMEKVKAGSNWTAERAESSALGYSEISLTILFRHSISTSTPVALWGMSQSFDCPWIPVFPRVQSALRGVLTGRHAGESDQLEIHP